MHRATILATPRPEVDAPMFYETKPLHFECTGCGRCCIGGGEYHVFLTDDAAETIRQHLQLSRAWFRRRYLRRLPDGDQVAAMGKDGRCIFLGKDNGCKVYEARPVQCRTYPFWPEVVNSRSRGRARRNGVKELIAARSCRCRASARRWRRRVDSPLPALRGEVESIISRYYSSPAAARSASSIAPGAHMIFMNVPPVGIGHHRQAKVGDGDAEAGIESLHLPPETRISYGA